MVLYYAFNFRLFKVFTLASFGLVILPILVALNLGDLNVSALSFLVFNLVTFNLGMALIVAFLKVIFLGLAVDIFCLVKEFSWVSAWSAVM
jgi:hypothetical protein